MNETTSNFIICQDTYLNAHIFNRNPTIDPRKDYHVSFIFMGTALVVLKSCPILERYCRSISQSFALILAAVANPKAILLPLGLKSNLT